MKKYKKIIVSFLIIAAVVIIANIFIKTKSAVSPKPAHFWKVQSVDTVKYSRDPAREHSGDASFDKTIDMQVKAIADSGANYVAIGTPYDKEFVPYLKRWVDSARKYGLNVWFRGNFSGWEKWFDYPAITRAQHQAMLKQFILDNGNLFQDGDIFTACTECENGGPGDPRQNGDVAGHRQFLIDEYQTGRNAFAQIGKDVATNYFPMNADVARLVMDPETTKSLGGLVVIDHYVPTPQDLNQGINDLANSSGGKVMLGEFGAPIPDLQGNLNETQQAAWIKSALTLLADNSNLVGINYWTSFGGSTELWNGDGTPKAAVTVLNQYFVPKVFSGRIINQAGKGIASAVLESADVTIESDQNGYFSLPYETNLLKVNISANGYFPMGIIAGKDKSPQTLTLKSKVETPIFKLQKLLYNVFGI